jgi:phage N-6-adenine-methyltransferase
MLDIPTVSEQVEQTREMNHRIKSLRSGSSKTMSSEGRQDYETPQELIEAVERDFGCIVFDLAASILNRKDHNFFGEGHNSLVQNWVSCFNKHKDDYDANFLWLNPPYKNVKPWMEKCRDESAKGAKILTLTLAAIDTSWYRKIVAPNAASYILTDRVTFVGEKYSFTKPLMLTEWGTGKTGLGYWDWKRK